MTEVTREIKENAIADIMAVQEIGWQGEIGMDKKEFSNMHSGTSESIGQFGARIRRVFNMKMTRNTLLEYENVNYRVCKIKIEGKCRNITITSVHAPTEEKEETEKENFSNALVKLCAKTSQHGVLIVMGDFNAKVGESGDQREVAGIHTLHEKNNDNGKMMVQFAAGFRQKYSAFNHKRIHF